MDETRFRELLEDVIQEGWDDVNVEDDDTAVSRVESYRDVGILTNNEGIVVELTDGSAFQITIVRSRS